MINYLVKDITTVYRGIVIHGTNCSGGFGSGVAGAIAKKWPFVRESFLTLKSSPDLLGTIQIVQVENTVYVVNGFTQVNFGGDGKRYADPNAVRSVLEKTETLVNHLINEYDLTDMPVYLPKIGCGLGGLSWADEIEPIVSEFTANIMKSYKQMVYVCDLA